ncbi:hypothetical protein [Chryseobacterium populi]|uniref:Uncharacterized protein n=1 Tax=Chryseobacterium populi TaxID=1144316 RepID=J2K6L6_9FLAO|nr:hypothetical protein [Chryseobacterium populi]EJL75860.1 hypothetical protein PMI13_00256 [Chryseobacterium populi]
METKIPRKSAAKKTTVSKATGKTPAKKDAAKQLKDTFLKIH